MALETATYIDGLNASNPAASDAISTADDHLRLIKSTIKATFPNITGPVTATQSDINTARAPLASPAFTGTPTAPTASSGTNTTQLATTAFVQAALQALYPVGSIYTNATNSTNPATLLGFGTWTAFAAGRVMVGHNASDPLFDTAEETGGSKDAIVVSHTHTATSTVTDPGHFHITGIAAESYNYQYGDSGTTNVRTNNSAGSTGYLAHTQTKTTGVTVATTNSTTGSSGTNANLPPYITVYMWKRTA
jgi:hypothetical protein